MRYKQFNPPKLMRINRNIELGGRNYKLGDLVEIVGEVSQSDIVWNKASDGMLFFGSELGKLSALEQLSLEA